MDIYYHDTSIIPKSDIGVEMRIVEEVVSNDIGSFYRESLGGAEGVDAGKDGKVD